MEMVELLVRMDCDGCEQKIHKHLAKLKGIHNIDIDMRMNKVTVVGYVDRRKVLKAVRKSGKRAEFWPQGYQYNNPHYHNLNGYDNSSSSHVYNTNDPSYMRNYPHGPHTFQNTYNYERHGYNHHDNLQEDTNPIHHASSSSISQASSLFSDDNPNACSIM